MKPLPSMHVGPPSTLASGLRRLTGISHPRICPVAPFVPRIDTRWPEAPSNSRRSILFAVDTVTTVGTSSEMRPEANTSAGT